VRAITISILSAVEPSSYATVKREADRTILPTGVIMALTAVVTATLLFLGVLWAWASEMPDWTFNSVALFPEPLVAVFIVLVYLWGRERIKRRVVANFNDDTGVDVLAAAGHRGAFRRYNASMAFLGLLLLAASSFYLAYLSSQFEVGDEDYEPHSTEERTT
jgi:hypothetical protein